MWRGGEGEGDGVGRSGVCVGWAGWYRGVCVWGQGTEHKVTYCPVRVYVSGSKPRSCILTPHSPTHTPPHFLPPPHTIQENRDLKSQLVEVAAAGASVNGATGVGRGVNGGGGVGIDRDAEVTGLREQVCGQVWTVCGNCRQVCDSLPIPPSPSPLPGCPTSPLSPSPSPPSLFAHLHTFLPPCLTPATQPLQPSPQPLPPLRI